MAHVAARTLASARALPPPGGWLSRAVALGANPTGGSTTEQNRRPRPVAPVSDGFETLVGLELHVQVDARSKLFSGSPTAVGAQPNSQVSVFDAALPGTLPVLNRGCVEAAVRTGVALGAQINSYSSFDRKHYFYSDLPHGYQITQLREPVVSGGCLDITIDKNTVKTVSIEQIQLEVDTGKSIHDVNPDFSFIDLNRAGCALMEVVTLPDMRSGQEAAAFVRTFQQLLRHIGTSDGNMEDGSLRVDVNVSVRATGADGNQQIGNRVEIKNLNSIRSIARAVDVESERHMEAMMAGGNVEKETRSFDAKANKTTPLRGKEAKLDYRFMVEPDLPPLVLSEEVISTLRASVPELPDAVTARLQRTYGLSKPQAKHFTRETGQRVLLEAIMMIPGESPELDGRMVANMVQGDILRCLKDAKLSFLKLPQSASPDRLRDVLVLLQENKLSRGLVKPMLDALCQGDTRAVSEVALSLTGGEDGMLDDDTELRSLCQQILQAQEKEVTEYRNGNARKMMSFVGALMKQTNGRADPKAATKIFKNLIDTNSES